MLRAEGLSIGVDMGVLLGGTVWIKRVEAVRPEIVLEVARDGRDCFLPGASVELPGGATASPGEFLDGCTSMEVRDLLASGQTVSGLASIEWGARMRDAGFVAVLDGTGERIERLRWFW